MEKNVQNSKTPHLLNKLKYFQNNRQQICLFFVNIRNEFHTFIYNKRSVKDTAELYLKILY